MLTVADGDFVQHVAFAVYLWPRHINLSARAIRIGFQFAAFTGYRVDDRPGQLAITWRSGQQTDALTVTADLNQRVDAHGIGLHGHQRRGGLQGCRVACRYKHMLNGLRHLLRVRCQVNPLPFEFAWAAAAARRIHRVPDQAGARRQSGHLQLRTRDHQGLLLDNPERRGSGVDPAEHGKVMGHT